MSSRREISCPYEECCKMFSSKFTLSEHINVHLGLKPYKCTVEGCDASFASRGNLTKHIKTHSDLKIYKCTEESCDKSFHRKEHLETHMRTHTNEKPYNCTYPGCTDKFSHKSTLLAHTRMHEGVKPYKCSYEGCEASFIQSIHLRVHMRSHTKEKPYKCTYPGCTLAFITRSNLNIHMRIHTKEKPYKCNYEGCEAKFSRKHHLDYHMYIHTGNKPYKCTEPDCDASFRTNSNLKNHIKAIHTKEGQARQKKQEQRIARLLEKEDIAFKREHEIDFSCAGTSSRTCARIDFLIDLNSHIIMLEVDENQHRFGYGGVSCDMRRMTQIQETLAIDGNTIPIIFLRYNPDAFKVDGETVSLKKKDREAILVEILQDPTHEIFNTGSSLTIQYMFYDTSNNITEITNDPEYHPVMRSLCLPCII